MYRDVGRIFSRYWNAYGGFWALIRSPYLHASLVLLVVTFGSWSEPKWWDTVIDVLPNLLGFTLGGFAVFLGFGDEKFRQLLAEPDEDDPSSASLYVSLCATFVHFIAVQICALIVALIAKSWWFYAPWPDSVSHLKPVANLIGGGLGYGLFIYALALVLAATMHVFRIATWYEQHQQHQASGCVAYPRPVAANDDKDL